MTAGKTADARKAGDVRLAREGRNSPEADNSATAAWDGAPRKRTLHQTHFATLESTS